MLPGGGGLSQASKDEWRPRQGLSWVFGDLWSHVPCWCRTRKLGDQGSADRGSPKGIWRNKQNDLGQSQHTALGHVLPITCFCVAHKLERLSMLKWWEKRKSVL